MTADRTGRNSALLAPLAWFAAALMASFAALRDPRWWADRDVLVSAAWPGSSWLASPSMAGANAIVLWRTVIALLLTLGAWWVARCVHEWRGDRVGAFASGALFVVSASAASASFDPAGVLPLLATMAFLAFAHARLAAPLAWGRAVVAGVVAIGCSAGALLPALVAIALALRGARGGGGSGEIGVTRAARIAPWLLLVAVVVQFGLQVPVGFAIEWSALPNPDSSAARSETAATVVMSLVRGAAGFVSPTPFVDSWQPHSFAGGFAAVAIMLALALAASWPANGRVRALALGALIVLSTALLVVVGRELPLVPLTVVLPGVAWISVALGAAQARVAGGVALLLLFLSCFGFAGGTSVGDALRSSDHPLAAKRLDEFGGEVGGDFTAQECAVFAAAGAPRSLAADVEWTLGLALLQCHERAGDGTAALHWIERWLAARPIGSAPLPALEAREIELLLRHRGVDAAAERLAGALAERGLDAEWVAAVAGAMVEALHRHAKEPRFVATVLPLVERLLAGAAERPERASAEELECLALLRVGQQRLVEAVTLAERAIVKAPDRAQPHLVLARIYLGRGEVDAGLRAVALARKIDPADAAAMLLEGRLYCSNADLAERGVERMAQALAADPTLPGIREEFEAGAQSAIEAVVARGGLELATELAMKAIAALGRRPALLHAYARVAIQRRSLGAAVSLLEEFLVAKPDDATARGELAQACRDAGYAQLLQHDRAAAIVCFERAIAVAPVDFDCTGMRSVIAQQRVDEEAAKDPVIAAARSAFDDALRLHQAGDRAAAIAALRRSLELLSMNPLAHLYLGKILLELGEAKAAEGALRTAIAIGAVQQIDVEEAWPLLLRALVDQEAAAKKISAAVDEYLRTYPEGRYRGEIEALRTK